MGDAAALENLDPLELIVMDKNYQIRINYRRKILKEHHDIAVGVNNDKRIGPAVRELYTFLLGTYLPTRYPSMFKLHRTEYEGGHTFMLENLTTKEMLLAQSSEATQTLTLLETLGKHLDEDFLFLLPEENEDQDLKYVLEAYITVCPSGFNPREKLGKKLADVHGPVPGYKTKLERSMDRFFAKLEVGRYVRRVNWSCTVDTELFAADGGNHAYGGDTIEELEDIDIDQVRLTLIPENHHHDFLLKRYIDFRQMRTPDAASIAEVESTCLCVQDLSLPDQGHQGRGIGRRFGAGYRWHERGQRTADALLQKRARLGTGREEVSSQLRNSFFVTLRPCVISISPWP